MTAQELIDKLQKIAREENIDLKTHNIFLFVDLDGTSIKGVPIKADKINDTHYEEYFIQYILKTHVPNEIEISCCK